jgi:hydrogenase maturation protease
MGSLADPALIVFAWGNASRGDDGIGPLLASRLRATAKPELRVIEDHQLNIEHVMDFHGMTPLLFIDASVGIEEDVRLERITASQEGNFSTHAISPQALLNVYRESMGYELPEAFILHVAGTSFRLGDALSSTATAAADKAWEFLQDVLSLSATDWGRRLSQAAA